MPTRRKFRGKRTNVYAVLDAAGVVRACGETDSFVVPAGGRLVQTDTDPLVGLAPDTEVYQDGTTFRTRPRVLDADEADARDIRDRLRAALNNWDSLTANQKDALLKVCVRGLLRALR
jgi:hypothetical protein